MIRTYDFKIYPNQTQIATLNSWLSTCCCIYNRALEQRIKAYERRGESVQYNDQQSLLTHQRGRIDRFNIVPVRFERDALRRVDRGFKAFFRRLKTGGAPGFPRFRSRLRYNSLECCEIGNYGRDGSIRIPCLGVIRARGRDIPSGKQRILRIIRRATGWYAQIVIDTGTVPPETRPVETSVGIDVGIKSIAALSTGEVIENPKWLAKSARKLRSLQRRLSRRPKIKGRTGRNRLKAIRDVARCHERIASRRKSYLHEFTTDIVRRFDLIAIESLNVNGMSRSCFGKSILDAAWGILRSQLAYKAECAGCQLVEVAPRGTSQECPNCGVICPKELSERVHSCSCGCVIDRDVAAARVILSRALVATGATRPWRERALADETLSSVKLGPVKQEDRKAVVRLAK